MNNSSNGNTFQLPEPSKADAVDISPSTILQDEKLLAKVHSDEQGEPDALVTYSDLNEQLNEMKLAKNTEILFSCDNVQFYFISPDGRVSSTLEPNKLIIARLHDISLDEPEQTFLQVGNWIYPLIPEVSPCIRAENGAFIFPDVQSETEGAAVGIILPEDVANEVHELFTHLLNEVSATGRARRSVVTDTSGSYSSKLLRGAAYLSHSVVRGAEHAARFLDYSAPKIMDYISPSMEEKEVNPVVIKGVGMAKTVSEKAVNVTDYLATKIYMATSALGKHLSPHIHTQGTRLLATATHMTKEEASEKLDSILNVTSDAMEGISTIYSGLEAASGILGQSLTNNTVQIIEHKYGHPVGALTNDAITTFGNIYYTRQNFRIFRPKAIAKAAVRGAGHALLEDHRSSHTDIKPHDEFQGAGPGSGSGFSTT